MLLFGVVGISSLIAGLSWWQITGSPLVGVGFAMGWFILFSLLDRSLMASLDGVAEPLNIQGETWLRKVKRLSFAWGKTLAAYATRIAVVVLTAHVSTTVVQGFVFGPEIERVIADRAQKFVEPAAQQLAQATKKRDEANQQYGKMVTGWNEYLTKERNVLRQYEQAGRSTEAAEIRKQIEAKEKEFTQIRASGTEKKALTDAEAGIVSAEAGLARAHEQAAQPVGQADRDKILAELAETRPIIKYLYWMIFVIELAAFIAKVLRGKDEYDYLITHYKEWCKTIKFVPPQEDESFPEQGMFQTVTPLRPHGH